MKRIFVAGHKGMVESLVFHFKGVWGAVSV